MTALDIEKRQVLVEFPLDANFMWHHRILFVKGPGATWVVGTPTFSIQELLILGK